MTTKKPEYDRFAKQLWVKVYQEELTRSHDNEEAKDTADLAMADYMSSIHGVTSVVKENFTTGIEHVDIRRERDNYYDRLQELRKENANLEAENERIRIKLSDTLYDLVETKAENKRLKEQNENLDVAYMAGMVHARKEKYQSVDNTNMIEGKV